MAKIITVITTHCDTCYQNIALRSEEAGFNVTMFKNLLKERGWIVWGSGKKYHVYCPGCLAVREISSAISEPVKHDYDCGCERCEWDKVQRQKEYQVRFASA